MTQSADDAALIREAVDHTTAVAFFSRRFGVVSFDWVTAALDRLTARIAELEAATAVMIDPENEAQVELAARVLSTELTRSLHGDEVADNFTADDWRDFRTEVRAVMAALRDAR